MIVPATVLYSLVPDLVGHHKHALEVLALVNGARGGGGAHARHGSQTHNLTDHLAVLAKHIEIESGQNDSMIVVQTIRIRGGIQTLLPHTKVTQIRIDIARASQLGRILAKDLQAFQYKINASAQRRMMVEQLHAVDHGQHETYELAFRILWEIAFHMSIQIAVHKDRGLDVQLMRYGPASWRDANVTTRTCHNGIGAAAAAGCAVMLLMMMMTRLVAQTQLLLAALQLLLALWLRFVEFRRVGFELQLAV